VSDEIRRLGDQLRRAFEGEAWHGPSVLEAIEDVTAEQASTHPIAEAHSILELVLHLGGTYRLVLRRLKGDGRQLTPVEDWPPPSSSSDPWLDAVGTLRELHAELVRAVEGFPEARLDLPLVPESPYSAYTQFIGLTQHNLYHAGQIALLKRARYTHPR
jgi:uncharacterized damage-inducible protein DinB